MQMRIVELTTEADACNEVPDVVGSRRSNEGPAYEISDAEGDEEDFRGLTEADVFSIKKINLV